MHISAPFPLTYARIAYRFLNPNAEQAARLFANTGLNEKQLLTLEHALPLAQQWQWYENLLEVSGDANLGWRLGRHLQLSAHGALGVAFYSAPRLGEAMECLARFIHLREPFFHPRLERTNTGITVSFTTQVPLGRLARFFTQAVAGAVCSAISSCIGKEFDGQLHLPLNDPPGARTWMNLPEVSFNAPALAWEIPTSLLALPSLLADAPQFQRALAECEAALATTAGTHSRTSHPRPYRARVAELMRNNPGQLWTLEDLAEQLHISARTLIRNLAKEGTHFTALKEQLVLERACQYLANPHLSMDAIASLLGFHDAASFRRSFKRMTGFTPSAYRRAQT
ncbi:AraC family transcriptional regulator [Simiduia sp. 21SJ11W-1]|uniref:AraC family transcriptional regulator n=1 Tax=Simiduia sp. 21SJ11W-1 TaxID=2909669 RepID=UPI00209F222E|nr:AraC family transcriptional regulator [Simiduia sp. 21SJ11W-1]UTA47094.1 AraC family transcriptional regulator [Simiduia sp. 21SJ11W-1]